jgi:hypothetical protein
MQVAKRRKARIIAESRLICMVADNGCSELMQIYRTHVETILTRNFLVKSHCQRRHCSCISCDLLKLIGRLVAVGTAASHRAWTTKRWRHKYKHSKSNTTVNMLLLRSFIHIATTCFDLFFLGHHQVDRLSSSRQIYNIVFGI